MGPSVNKRVVNDNLSRDLAQAQQEQPPLPSPVASVGAVQRIVEAASEREGMLCLDRNERLSPLPITVEQELATAIAALNWAQYPNTDNVYLALQQHYSRPRQDLLVTPGSDGALRSLFQAFVESGDIIVTLRPSYAMYEVYAALAGATVRAVDADASLSIDVDNLIDHISDGVKLVILANPNQPTGVSLSQVELERVLARVERVGALLVVDEAYASFADFSTIVAFPGRPNLITMQTFSKAWGLAGLRVGVVIADPSVITALATVRSVYDITSAGATAVEIVLRHPEVAAAYRDEIDEARRYLSAELADLGLFVFASETNFLVIRTAPVAAPARLVEQLHSRGILVRGPFSHPSMVDCIRITLGPRRAMEMVVTALREIVSSQ